MKILVISYFSDVAKLEKFIIGNIPSMKIVSDSRAALFDYSIDTQTGQPLQGDITVFDMQNPSILMSDFIAEKFNSLGNGISSGKINHKPTTWLVLDSSSNYTAADITTVLNWIIANS